MKKKKHRKEELEQRTIGLVVWTTMTLASLGTNNNTMYDGIIYHNLFIDFIYTVYWV